MMTAEAYFRSVAIDVFGDRLRELGARLVGADPWVVRFESDRWFVELVALMSDGPRYSPRVLIGPLPERGILARQRQFDILHTLPVGSPLRRYNLEWRYADAAAMRVSYVRALNEIFEPHAVEVLCDPERLEALLDCRSRQVEADWRNEIRDHNENICRTKARTAWEAKDYRTYLSNMKTIPSERQSASDKARIRYVEKLVGRQ